MMAKEYRDQRANWISFLNYMGGKEKVSDASEFFEERATFREKQIRRHTEAMGIAENLIEEYENNGDTPKVRDGFKQFMDLFGDSLRDRWAILGEKVYTHPDLAGAQFIDAFGGMISSASLAMKRRFGVTEDQNDAKHIEHEKLTEEWVNKINAVAGPAISISEDIGDSVKTASAVIDALVRVALGHSLILAEALTAIDVLDKAKKQGNGNGAH